MLLPRQLSLERRDLLLNFGKPGRRAADLRDEFMKRGAVHCSPHAPVAERRPRKLHKQKRYISR